MAVLRYTQSNSVCYGRDGMTLGIGAGQQSRVDCTRLAGAKVGTWWLRRHPAIRDLSFAPGLTRQDKINWQVRLLVRDRRVGQHRQDDVHQQLPGLVVVAIGLVGGAVMVIRAARGGGDRPRQLARSGAVLIGLTVIAGVTTVITKNNWWSYAMAAGFIASMLLYGTLLVRAQSPAPQPEQPS